jgi:4-amino-4-deoxy-L-arabinose transferase-like glycosyltransferase
LLPLVNHPGIGDPNHYYNLGVRLVEGYGFTIDYIWQYNDPPTDIVHPDDHWMPLTGVMAAAGMKLFGTNVPAALLPFILAGGCVIPVVTYAAARQFGCSEIGSLAAAGFAAMLPEFVLNSLRTDTTIPNIVFICGSVLLFNAGLRRGWAWPMIGSGALAGLAYLTRNDALVLIPTYGVTLLIWLAPRSRANVPRLRWRHLVLLPLAAGVVVAPWIVRNVQVLGTPATRELSKMLFFTDALDHYAYQRVQSPDVIGCPDLAQLVGKRLFELAAAGKFMVATLDVFPPVAVAGGFILLIASRDRERLLILTPTLVMLAVLLVVYPILVPYKSQAGSFKKAYLSIIPLLIPLGIYALERAVPDARLRAGAMILGIILTGANAFGLVRTPSLPATSTRPCRRRRQL